MLVIKMIWMLELIVYSLLICALAFANEWNAFTFVPLIDIVICQGFSAVQIAVGLWSAMCRTTHCSSRRFERKAGPTAVSAGAAS